MDETTATDQVRVATLNLWGRRGEWEERRRVLAEGFRGLRPDLVAFQEAVVGSGYDQVTDVLGEGYHLAHQTDRELGRGGDIEDGLASSSNTRSSQKIAAEIQAAKDQLINGSSAAPRRLSIHSVKVRLPLEMTAIWRPI